MPQRSAACESDDEIHLGGTTPLHKSYHQERPDKTSSQGRVVIER